MLLTVPFLIVLCIAFPLLGLLQSRAGASGADEVPTVGQMAVQLGTVQTVIAVLAALAMYGGDITVNWQGRISSGTVLLALALLAGVVVLSRLEARRPLRPENRVRARLRETSANHPAWLGLTVCAGVVEEFAYRGVLTLLLAQYLPYWPAALVSALAFGLSHLAGGWRSAAYASAFALAMQLLVAVSGGLLLAVVVHTAYDLLAAYLGSRIAGRRRR